MTSDAHDDGVDALRARLNDPELKAQTRLARREQTDKRANPRHNRPALAITLGSMVYRTRNWSVGGLLLDECRLDLRRGDRAKIEVTLPGTAGLRTLAVVVRVDRVAEGRRARPGETLLVAEALVEEVAKRAGVRTRNGIGIH